MAAASSGLQRPLGQDLVEDLPDISSHVLNLGPKLPPTHCI